MKQKVVVTGGAGFIGSHVAQHVCDAGYDVHVVDNLSAGKVELVPSKAQFHNVDICDSPTLQDVIKDTTYIFHLAANPRVQDSIDTPLSVHATNVDGTLSVLEAAKQHGVSKVIFSSSAAVYGDLDAMPLTEEFSVQPMSPYGLHKYIGEHYCRLWSLLYDVPTVSLRYFNVYGPNFDPYGAYPLVVGYFLERLKQGKTLTVTGDGSHTRDYVHVTDIARANLLAAQSNCMHGEVINIGSGTETSVLHIAQSLGGEIEYVEARIEPARSCAQIDKAKELLGWSPSVRFKDGLQKLQNAYLG